MVSLVADRNSQAESQALSISATPMSELMWTEIKKWGPTPIRNNNHAVSHLDRRRRGTSQLLDCNCCHLCAAFLLASNQIAAQEQHTHRGVHVSFPHIAPVSPKTQCLVDLLPLASDGLPCSLRYCPKPLHRCQQVWQPLKPTHRHRLRLMVGDSVRTSCFSAKWVQSDKELQASHALNNLLDALSRGMYQGWRQLSNTARPLRPQTWPNSKTNTHAPYVMRELSESVHCEEACFRELSFFKTNKNTEHISGSNTNGISPQPVRAARTRARTETTSGRGWLSWRQPACST